jgi:hypothetical protein
MSSGANVPCHWNIQDQLGEHRWTMVNRWFFRPWWVWLDHIGSLAMVRVQHDLQQAIAGSVTEPCLAMSLTNPGRSPAGKMTQKWQKWFPLFNLNLWKNAAISGPYHVKLSDDQSGWVPAFDFCFIFFWISMLSKKWCHTILNRSRWIASCCKNGGFQVR